MPEFDLGDAYPRPGPEQRPRNYVGWAILILFFAVFVPRATIQAVTRSPSASKIPPATETVLKESMAMRQVVRQVAPSQSTGDIDSSLEDTAKKLAEPGKSDDEAAMLYVAIRREEGKPYEPAYIDVLRKSKDDAKRAFGEVYGSDKLTTQQAQALASRIKGDRFVYRLARAEARYRAGDARAKADVAPASLGFGVMAFFLAAGLALLAGLGLWIAYIAFRGQGRFAPEGHPAGSLSLPVADLFAIRAAQLLGIFILAPLLVHYLVPLGDAARGLISGILVIGGTLAVTRLRIGDYWIDLKTLGVDTREFGKRLLWAVSGYLANAPAIALAATIGLTLFKFLPTPEHPASETLMKTHDPLSVISLLFLACVQAPIFEETLFRGILFPALTAALKGPVAGAIVSSLLFALLHPQGPALWLALATVGAMNCFLTYQTRSLVPAMILHAIHNGVLMVLTLVLS